MCKQNCLQRLMMEEKVLASKLKYPQKMSKNASSPLDGILFTAFCNIFMVEIKEKTKSVNKIKDA